MTRRVSVALPMERIVGELTWVDSRSGFKLATPRKHCRLYFCFAMTCLAILLWVAAGTMFFDFRSALDL